MADIIRPTFTPVFEEAEGDIRSRILARIPDTWRKEPGDFVYDTVAAVPLEIKQGQINKDTILKNGFAQYAEGDYLDKKLDEVGLSRAQATKAQRTLQVTADAGVIIPAGYVASTVVLDSGGNPLEFTVDMEATFTEAGTLDIVLTASEAGSNYNVPNGSEFILLPPIPGIRTIVDAGTLVPGADKESDVSAWQRYDFKVKNPDTGGNKNDYVRWAQEVTGVGKARCIQRWNGNGTVKVLLVGTDNRPAAASIVDDVQEYIDPILDTNLQAESMEAGGFGVTVNDSDATLAYNASGEGTLTYGAATETLIETENHFKARFKVKVDSIAGTTDLLQLTIQDRGTKEPLKQTVSSTSSAQAIVTAADLGTDYVYVEVPFYWDGLQSLETEVRRLTTDTATVVTVDLVNFVGLYGQALGEGKAPGSHRTYAKAADDLPVSIQATVDFSATADPTAVKAAFEAAVEKYLASLIFTDMSVVYARIGALLIGTEGVSNYTNLLVNGGTADLPVGLEEVATLGTVTI